MRRASPSSDALATEGLGINLAAVPPRSKAFPRHYHYVNHELFVIFDGIGVLHHGKEDHALKPLDVVFIRAGTGIPFRDLASGDLARFSHWFRRDSAVGYWDGEVEEG
ncbi:cupin domain-containing protein [Rhodosalinus sp. FB01]|uniref:cupin domain-containing protein n=1 Tax=Rhodosalinus sp. FB01 TaxID=3239194 RepID=UPI00352615DB